MKPNNINQMVLAGGSNVFDADAFDNAIRSHGVLFIHYRSMLNPIGMIDKYDIRKPSQDLNNIKTSNNRIYTKAGEFIGLMMSNTSDSKAFNGGLIDGGTAQMSTPRTYEHQCDKASNRLMFAPYDRLYLKDENILVPQSQVITKHETGRDKLRFPALEVLDLMDSNGQRFDCNDFTIDGTDLVWKNPNAVGDVFSIRYFYRPYWYVQRLLHEIRVAQHENELTGEMEMIQMPQSFIVQREYLFESEENKDEEGWEERQGPGPEDGGLGPR